MTEKLQPDLNIKKTRGALLLEVLLAMFLFSIAIATMALIIFPLFQGTRTNTFRPHVNRVQLELLARALDHDFNTFGPVLVYNGQVQQGDSWISPATVTLNQGTPAEVTQDTFLSRAEWQPGQTYNLAGNDDSNTTDPRYYTLIFVGLDSNIDPGSGDYTIDIASVYRLIVQNNPPDPATPERLSYQISRISLEEGLTHAVSFDDEGLKLSDPGTKPRFVFTEDSGVAVIKAILPNPLSPTIVDDMGEHPYFDNITLFYNLSPGGADGRN